MANLSKYHIVFSSSTLIHLNKDAFEVHLCQTVNKYLQLFFNNDIVITHIVIKIIFNINKLQLINNNRH